MSGNEFMSNCTACGGNWGAMLLTGVKHVFPNEYDKVFEQYNSTDFRDGGIKAFTFLCDWLTEHGIVWE